MPRRQQPRQRPRQHPRESTGPSPRRGPSEETGRGAIPRWIIAVAGLGTLFVLVPIVAIISRVNWSQFVPMVTTPASLAALELSISTALASTALCVVIGIPIALVLAGKHFFGQPLVRSLVLLPLVLPPVVGGIALLYTFGRAGLLGRSLSFFGIEIAFSTTAVILAQTFVSIPFLVLSLEGALRAAGSRFEEVSATLGARPSIVLWRVTLPLIRPALISGAILSFARALGEFGATLTFAGSLQGVTRTLPLEIYLRLESDPDAAVALALVLVAVALLVVTLATRRSPVTYVPRGDPTGSAHVEQSKQFAAAQRGTAAAQSAAAQSAAAQSAAAQSAAAQSAAAQPVPAQPVPAQPVPAQSLSFSAQLSSRDFDVALEVAPGETLAVLGRNGSGKSTLLALIAGLLTADTGTAHSGTKMLFDIRRPAARRAGSLSRAERTATAQVVAAIHSRGVSLLAQSALLFPHLSVRENVAFGPRNAGCTRAQSRAIALRWLREVDALHLADAWPGEVSAGQAQRIAVARSLACGPRVVLLDEPFAALDVSVAPAIRRMLRRVLANRTAIIVTHNILDALFLADRVIVIDRGRVVETGTPAELASRPKTAFGAQLAGLNFIAGERTSNGLRTTQGHEFAAISADETHPGRVVAPGAPVALVVRPSAVTISRDRPRHSVDNVFSRRIDEIEPRGDFVRVRSGIFMADISPAVAAAADLVPGSSLWFHFDSSDATVYPI